ncbi:organomercurial lyase [Micromonospora sicca]|uniref:organomercurial lyase n=1 Tax=Micromonospora sicca TaxID=2202420 RepID=UPI001374D99C|nr:organomercurial lyase [Micromonospora sp. 4G51]
MDLLPVDDGGRLIAAYPFSPVPTPHTVSLGDVDVFAMCAIHALGMPFMLDTDALITSADPHTGKPIQVTVAEGAATYQPPEAVVVYAASRATGRSVDTCCFTINFFTSARKRPGVDHRPSHPHRHRPRPGPGHHAGPRHLRAPGDCPRFG